MYNPEEVAALVERVHKLDEERDGLIGQLIELIKPMPDEIEDVYTEYREDGKGSAQYLTELMLPLVVLDNRQVEAEMAAEEAADDGGHN